MMQYTKGTVWMLLVASLWLGLVVGGGAETPSEAMVAANDTHLQYINESNAVPYTPDAVDAANGSNSTAVEATTPQVPVASNIPVISDAPGWFVTGAIISTVRTIAPLANVFATIVFETQGTIPLVVWKGALFVAMIGSLWAMLKESKQQAREARK